MVLLFHYLTTEPLTHCCHPFLCMNSDLAVQTESCCCKSDLSTTCWSGLNLKYRLYRFSVEFLLLHNNNTLVLHDQKYQIWITFACCVNEAFLFSDLVLHDWIRSTWMDPAFKSIQNIVRLRTLSDIDWKRERFSVVLSSIMILKENFVPYQTVSVHHTSHLS